MQLQLLQINLLKTMDLKEYQNQSEEIVNKLDKKFKIERTPEMNISQLVEELGELSKEVNKQNLRGEIPKKEELEDEFADVFIQLGRLANSFDINLEKAILNKILILKEKHNL